MAIRLRTCLADRFGLKSHLEKRELKAYVLSVGKSDSKLAPGDPAARGAMATGPGVVQAYSATMDQFVSRRAFVVLMTRSRMRRSMKSGAGTGDVSGPRFYSNLCVTFRTHRSGTIFLNARTTGS